MHGAGLHALLGGPLPQLYQDDVRLRLDQTPDQPGIDAAGSPPLRNPLITPALTLGSGDLQHPAVAHIEALSQLTHRALAGPIGRQHLAPKIIAIRSRHLLTITQTQTIEKYLDLYPKVKWSRLEPAAFAVTKMLGVTGCDY